MDVGVKLFETVVSISSRLTSIIITMFQLNLTSSNLNSIHLVVVLQTDVHDVVEDHEVAEVVNEVDDAQDDVGDHNDQGVRLGEDREDSEKLHQRHHQGEDDVGS